MKIKIKDKEYSFDGYANPIESIQSVAKECYEQGRADAIKEVFAKINQPYICLFNQTSACNYPIDDCMNCPITIKEMKKEQ